GPAAFWPFVVVAADAMQEIKDRVLFVLGIARRRIDGHLARATADLGFVVDYLDLAVLDAVALGVEASRRRGIRIGRLFAARILGGMSRHLQCQKNGAGSHSSDTFHGVPLI